MYVETARCDLTSQACFSFSSLLSIDFFSSSTRLSPSFSSLHCSECCHVFCSFFFLTRTVSVTAPRNKENSSFSSWGEYIWGVWQVQGWIRNGNGSGDQMFCLILIRQSRGVGADERCSRFPIRWLSLSQPWLRVLVESVISDTVVPFLHW